MALRAMLDYRDPRIKAAIILSAPPFYGESDPAKILANVTVPTLHVTATQDIIRILGNSLTVVMVSSVPSADSAQRSVAVTVTLPGMPP